MARFCAVLLTTGTPLPKSRATGELENRICMEPVGMPFPTSTLFPSDSPCPIRLPLDREKFTPTRMRDGRFEFQNTCVRASVRIENARPGTPSVQRSGIFTTRTIREVIAAYVPGARTNSRTNCRKEEDGTWNGYDGISTFVSQRIFQTTFAFRARDSYETRALGI